LQVDQTAAGLVSRFDECRIAFQERFPKLRDQLGLRAGPLMDRWQTFGPGLLIEAARLIWQSAPPKHWWPTSLDALLVQPVRGGDGGCIPAKQQVWIEAMLTDADPQVGETLRLAYWITQLAIARHLQSKLGAEPLPTTGDEYDSRIHRTHSLPWDLGTVPVILAAGQTLELFRSPQLPIATAVRLWRLGDQRTGDVVAGWWDQWSDSGAAMPVALKALDRMLAPVRESTAGGRPGSPVDAGGAEDAAEH